MSQRSDGPTLAREFTSWYESSYPAVLAVLKLVTQNDDVAEDAVAEAYARAYGRWARVGRMENSTGWVYTVARSIARRSRQPRDDGNDNPAESGIAEAAQVESLDLLDAVGQLSRRQQDALALRYLADLRQHDVAARLGVAPGTVAATLHQARARLLQILGRDYR